MEKSVELTEEGIAAAELALDTEDFWSEKDPLAWFVMSAFCAEEFYQRDVPYIVKDGAVQIVDEEKEFLSIFQMPVVEVPTNLPNIRVDLPVQLYSSGMLLDKVHRLKLSKRAGDDGCMPRGRNYHLGYCCDNCILRVCHGHCHREGDEVKEFGDL